MLKVINIDIETYSDVDLKKCGLFKYVSSPNFEILLIAYSIGAGEVNVIDLAQGENVPTGLISALSDPAYKKKAFNAAFEVEALKRGLNIETPYDQWECTQFKAAYCGLPLSLSSASFALQLGAKGKRGSGKKLIQKFCVPQKQKEGGLFNTVRIRPEDAPSDWSEFKEYCRFDVISERAIGERLSAYSIPEEEQRAWVLDKEINARGVAVDLPFVKKAAEIAELEKAKLIKEIKSISGIDNPKSVPQLKRFLEQTMGVTIPSIAKDKIKELIKQAPPVVKNVLRLRAKASKSSVSKYDAIINSAGADSRVRGLLQFYGANRTGRWAGRLVQIQNLPRNYNPNLNELRDAVLDLDLEGLRVMHGDPIGILSELIRTSFVSGNGKDLVVSDFSAIEARVLAWLAGEAWKLEVFESHGKIYEAAASKMFGVPVEQITKDSEYRARGKVAELALGYQGGVGALRLMGAEKMGLSTPEMSKIVNRWRDTNLKIVKLWDDLEMAAIRAIRTRQPQRVNKNVVFEKTQDALTVKLPSGRRLFYWSAHLATGKFDKPTVHYYGVDGQNWGVQDSYGGKFCENIVQAIARDLLSDWLIRCSDYNIVMHVHDEAVIEPRQDEDPEDILNKINSRAQDVPGWARGLPMKAEGFITKHYKKD